LAKYFLPDEIVGLDPKLIDMLDRARGIAKVPFVITSGKRTVDENTAAGGVGDSSHLRGLAVDLACKESRSRYFILSALFQAGFTRLGIYARDGHIHCDCDDSLPQQVVWVNT